MLGARRAFAEGACLVAVAACLAGCGVGADPGQDEPNQVSKPSFQGPRVLRKEQMRLVLPDLSDVPPGWKRSGATSLDGSASKDAIVASGRGAYLATDLGGYVGFHVTSFESLANATEAYAKLKSKYPATTLGSVQIPFADAAFSASNCPVKSSCSALISVRVAMVDAYVNINTDGPVAADPRILNSVTRMLVQRIRQAQRGQQPSAKAT